MITIHRIKPTVKSTSRPASVQYNYHPINDKVARETSVATNFPVALVEEIMQHWNDSLPEAMNNKGRLKLPYVGTFSPTKALKELNQIEEINKDEYKQITFNGTTTRS